MYPCPRCGADAFTEEEEVLTRRGDFGSGLPSLLKRMYVCSDCRCEFSTYESTFKNADELLQTLAGRANSILTDAVMLRDAVAGKP